MAYLLAGPLVAIVGIVAVFFVLRRKSVDKRSMYSARRSQIEHKVRAARQRTMAPHGRSEKPSQPVPAAETPFAATQVQETATTWQAPAYEPPPSAGHAPVPPPRHEEPAAPPPWEQPSTPAPAPSSFDYPGEPAPALPPEPFRPAPKPTPMPAPGEPAWTPAPRPAEPMAPAEPVAPAASATSAGAWSVVSTSKDGAVAEPESKKKDKGGAPASSWQLASGDAPGLEAEEPEGKRPAGTLMALAQYAILVVGLVMVLIGVLVMVANSHVT
ncbi:MAG: hypothetical protein E6I41_03195 [Chloroflexi bacterium]|nr:MAG: hypothetical protein E6I41_03195 [Chloroflexota bacterium]